MKTRMDPVRTIGVLAFAVASFLVGARLLLLARRTRELPELAVGLALVLAGGAGYALMFASARLAPEPATAGAFAALGALSLNAGAVSLWFFTWRVFRPESAWAAVLVAAAAAAAGSSYLHELLTTGFAFRSFQGVWYWSGFAARLLCFGWAALESLRYWAMMRRRARLGLAEPLLANRFLLWALAAAGAFAIWAVVGWNLLQGSNQPTGGLFENDAALLVSGFGLASALALWLAFFPPLAYRRRFDAVPLAAARGGVRG